MAEQINVNEFKPGITFVYNGDAYMVLDSEHSKSGRGQAHVKCKVKNLLSGSIQSLTFTGGERVEKAYVNKQDMQFLYIDGSQAMFMNNETFEQMEIDTKSLTEELKYIVEGSNVLMMIYEGKVFGIDIPNNVELTVTEAADAVRGDTVTNATKKATLETGITIDVPQFIDQGQKIIVNTKTGKYVGKAQ